MPRKAGTQNLLDALISQIGSEVARGVAEGLAKSGLMKSIRALSRDARKAPPSGRKRGRPRGKIKACSVKGCKNPARAKGMCSRHYQQKRYLKLKKNPAAKRIKKRAKRNPAKG